MSTVFNTKQVNVMNEPMFFGSGLGIARYDIQRHRTFEELIEKQRQVVLFQIQQLKETLSMLDYKKWYYETAEKAGSCKVHETMQEDDVPDNLRKARERAKGLFA